LGKFTELLIDTLRKNMQLSSFDHKMLLLEL